MDSLAEIRNEEWIGYLSISVHLRSEQRALTQQLRKLDLF